jgi:hypothetical protein
MFFFILKIFFSLFSRKMYCINQFMMDKGVNVSLKNKVNAYVQYLGIIEQEKDYDL